MELLLAADLGTTAVKAMVVDTEGEVLAEATREYVLGTPAPQRVEFPVAEYWSAFRSAVRQCVANERVRVDQVRAISLSVQGETLVLSDDSGEPVMNAIVWLDNRATEEAEALRQEFGDDECFRRTGQVSFTPTWPASKLLWLKKHMPDQLARSAHITLLEDYFLYRLSGSFACEPSLACSTVYWDLLGQTWWDDVLRFIGVSTGQLPELRASGDPLGQLTPAAAAELDLSTDVTVCVGGLDQACAAIGVGNINPGVFSENTGAALAICATVAEPIFDPERRMPLHAHAIPNTYMLHTFTSGGIVLRWFRDRFCTEELAVAERLGSDAYALLSNEAAAVPPGSDGLIMLPHLQGAMAPEDNADARGVFVGVTLQHHKGHFVRAIMEAIACAIRRNLEVVERLGLEVTEIRSAGGASASTAWSQIKADLTARPVQTMTQTQAACTGAAALAGVGIGLFRDLSEATTRLSRPGPRFLPDLENTRACETVYSRYVATYEALVPVFAKLASQ